METKKAIIQSAFTILSQEGADSLTTKRLVEEAGISKGGLYHHFESIEDVYMGVLEILMGSFTEGLGELEFRDLEHFTDVVVEMAFDDYEDQKNVYSSLFYFFHHATKKEHYRDRLYDWAQRNYSNWLELHSKIAKKEIPKDRLHEAMKILDIYFSGLMIEGFLTKDPISLKKTTSNFLKLINREYFGE